MSGVYISGIEMPKHGGINICIFSDGKIYKSFRGIGFEPVPDAHAVSVQNHGRLIDADKLQMRTEYVRMAEHYIKSEHVVLYDDVETAPTIIPADKED